MNRLIVILVTLAACGGNAAFHLTSPDNDRDALAAALAKRQLPEQPAPLNAARTARVFVVAAGNGPTKQLVAYDLARGSLLWTQDADVQSRVWVGGNFIVAVEAKQLVARDQQTGGVKWRAEVPGELVGAAADGDHAYLVWKESGSKWWVAGYDGSSGNQQWKADADGILGAPGAHGGIVYVPYNAQWLSIIDGTNGKILARIRGIDEQISMLRVTSRVAYYGSKQGVFRLDAKSASGKRAESSYAKVVVPAQLDRTTYGRDAYDPVQLAYTAADRTRILYAAPAEGLQLETYAVHYFRYVFGFDRTGALAWAYSNPRVELVASEDTGAAILAVSQTGDLVALDPANGAIRLQQSLGVRGAVLGATFDADGWTPPSQGEKVETLAALVSIARDHDSRFDRVKELAVQALARLPGGDATKELLGVLADERAPQHLKDVVVDLLVARKDPASLPVLAAQLSAHDDYLLKTTPVALGPVAKAIAGLGGAKLDPAVVVTALAALESHLDAPTTQVADLVFVIDAMAAIGGGKERPALGSHLLLYHADDELGGDTAWCKAIVNALETHGGPGERELLRQVAADPRTRPDLVTVIRDALAFD
ncbi:MAG: PQQ-binding-like beta-propeller repeat protein [Kofleriaceae bacterium]